MELIRVRKSTLSLDMAPLIDVVFQLLIFFMLTTSFANPSLMKLNLPRAVTEDKKDIHHFSVTIKPDGSAYLNDKQLSLDQLGQKLSEGLQRENTKVVNIQGDEDMPYKYFVEVMDIARQAGAHHVNIVHQKKQ